LLCAHHASAQLQDPDNAVELSHDYDESQKRLDFYADNKDFCDYYLSIFFFNTEGFEGISSGTPLTVGPGRRQVATYRVREGATRLSYNYRYVMYRGNSRKKPNIDFTYALPVAVSSAVTAAVAENTDGYRLDFSLPSDTAYACRGGVACDDNLKDVTLKGHKRFGSDRSMSQVTLYHADGSFGEYAFRGTPLVYPGQSVKMGAPIAVVAKTDRYLLRFAAYFLDKNKLKQDNGNKHTHFRPFFQTLNEGKTRLSSGATYFCERTDEMLMQEMSRREKKNFLKNKEQK
ncbi:MAG: M23 family metallopeptidase, partial [Prevotellaceae bacterium]|nr:M23 family metallopeptidase [Prevotellaceae bacterium]